MVQDKPFVAIALFFRISSVLIDNWIPFVRRIGAKWLLTLLDFVRYFWLFGVNENARLFLPLCAINNTVISIHLEYLGILVE